LDPVRRPLLRDQEDRVRLRPAMQRIPRTVTVAISALTAIAWVVGLLFPPGAATYVLGFIPARLSGVELPFAAVPAWLTPLSSTLAHSGLIHLGFNLLILLW